MTTVADLIRTHAARYDGELSSIHVAIHGTDDPTLIEEQLDRFLRHAVGSAIAEPRFHATSAGSVTGVVLDDGRAVVVKAYQDRWPRPFLDAVAVAQRQLVDAGLPCARPICEPRELGAGWATVETLLEDPGQPPAFGGAEMRSSARGLSAAISVLAPSPGLRLNPLCQPFPGLYPTPHSPVFDFDRTADGAEWIDDFSRQVRPHLEKGPVVAAHTDWSARNVRLSSTEVRAIYDLDSIGVVHLDAALGNAAVTWRSTAEPGDDAAPGLDEIEEWLDCYPAQLSDDVRRGAIAHALFHLAYSSRCEHAIDPEETRHRRARPTLRQEGQAFLRHVARIDRPHP